MTKVKTIDSLMRYMRDEHNIHIKGSNHKRKLRNFGYYHGFKGYRFIKSPQNRINFNDFNEVLAINNLDMELKGLFYPQIMFLETALKNYVLEEVLSHSRTDSFDDIYERLLDDYKRHVHHSDNYKFALRKRLELRNKIYGTLSRDYNTGRQVVQHFYHSDRYVPVWAIFEVINMGEFGHFFNCLNKTVRREVSKSLLLNQAFDGDALMTSSIIFMIKDLRNAVAHNDVIFDVRFKRAKIRKSLKKALQNDMNIGGINFNSITDYLLLLVYLQKKLGIPKTELYRAVRRFESLIDNFRQKVPATVSHQVFHTNTQQKLIALRSYIQI
ncbi:Abi family protein [Lentibacillus sp. Marseille-P4043]|uniref:Abi family protein n=1 Tax=Lentibacillus sp. Marseille-P4043 TaxID=2040293 RepID=UPI000D0B3ABD|nr:Abi family protein [Lentibacillus sp. Marseille-P4043]